MKKIIILGGNFESIPTILEAKKDFKVIVVDKNPAAPGFKHASLKIFESIFDYRSIIKILKKKRYGQISGVLCASTDAPMSVYQISKYLKFHYYSYKTANFFSNKYLMKKELKRKGVLVPWFKKINNLSQLENILIKNKKKKIVLKPCDSRGGRGVFLVNYKTKNLIDLYKETKSFTKLNYLIAEEFIEGEQYSTETIIYKNHYFTPGFCRRNYNKTKKYYPSIIENGGDQPVKLKESIKKSIINLIKKTGKISGLKNGIIKGDIVLSKDKKPYIIEVACRLSGGWFSSHQIPEATGVNIIKAAIKLSSLQKIDLKNLQNKYQKAVGIRYFFPKIGKIKKIFIPKNLKTEKNIIKLMFFKKKGDVVQQVRSHPDRVGFVILKEKSKSQLIKKLNNFVKRVKINTLKIS